MSQTLHNLRWLIVKSLKNQSIKNKNQTGAESASNRRLSGVTYVYCQEEPDDPALTTVDAVG
ncbi:hypothetical protein [Ectothiorhodospira magna]|uniref:hypothetical protein n=1 Tax=Ectothiorhodospira magna TaxID=867345 RepID=UPI00138FD61F|nr:hypothetical protein [Ectothiorhodospira magna]